MKTVQLEISASELGLLGYAISGTLRNWKGGEDSLKSVILLSILTKLEKAACTYIEECDDAPKYLKEMAQRGPLR